MEWQNYLYYISLIICLVWNLKELNKNNIKTALRDKDFYLNLMFIVVAPLLSLILLILYEFCINRKIV